ncbi:MAG: archaellin/type IV pilin N-terminal domain-containing protein [Nanoarchaeota archaeon]
MKRGVSPVVATVLLIAITVVLAAIIFLWAQSFLREGAQKNDRAVELSCDKIVFSAELYNDNNGVRTLGISNSGNVPIFGFEFRGARDGSITPESVQDSNGDSKLNPGESNNFVIGDYDSGLVVPVLLAEASGGNRVTYPCPDSTGKNVQLIS